MIFPKKKKASLKSSASLLVAFLLVASSGFVSMGCSGGGSSGGGGGTQGPQPTPSPAPTPVPASQSQPTAPSQVDSAQQVTITFNNVAGNPTPTFMVKDSNGNLLVSGQISNGTATANLTAPTLNVGDPDLAWNLLVSVLNTVNGQVQMDDKNVTITVRAPTSTPPPTPPAVPSTTLVNNIALNVENNHHSAQFAEVAVTFAASIDTTKIRWAFMGQTNLPWCWGANGTVFVALPAGQNSANPTEPLVLTIDGYSGNSSVAVPIGNRTSSFVALNRNDPTFDPSRVGIYSLTTPGNAVAPTYEGQPNGFDVVDAASLPFSGQRVFVGNEGMKGVLIRMLSNGTGQQKVDLSDGLTDATESQISYAMASWDGTKIAVVWKNRDHGVSDWQVTIFNAANLAVLRTIDTGISKTNVLHRFGTVRWQRGVNPTARAVQTYALLGDATGNQVIAIGMADGNQHVHALGFSPQACSQLILRNDVHNWSMVVAGHDAGGGNTVYRFVQFGLLQMTSDPAQVLRNAPAPLTDLQGIGYYYDTGALPNDPADDTQHLVYAYNGKTWFQVKQIGAALPFNCNLTAGYSVNAFAFLPGQAVAVAGNNGVVSGEITIIPVADFLVQANFQAPTNRFGVTQGSTTLGVTDEQQILWEVRGTTDQLRSYRIGDLTNPGVQNLATAKPVSNNTFIRGDRHRSITVRP